MELAELRNFLREHDFIVLPFKEWKEARQAVLDYGEAVLGQGERALFVNTEEPREHFVMWGKPVILEEMPNGRI